MGQSGWPLSDLGVSVRYMLSNAEAVTIVNKAANSTGPAIVAGLAALLGAGLTALFEHWRQNTAWNRQKSKDADERKRSTYIQTANAFYNYVHALSQYVIQKTEEKRIDIQDEQLTARIMEANYRVLLQDAEMRVNCPEGLTQYDTVRDLADQLRRWVDRTVWDEEERRLGVKSKSWDAKHDQFKKELHKLAQLAP